MYAMLLLVCTVRIIEKDGRDTLYFSKELSTNVTVIISYYDGQSSDIATYIPKYLHVRTSKDLKC